MPAVPSLPFLYPSGGEVARVAGRSGVIRKLSIQVRCTMSQHAALAALRQLR